MVFPQQELPADPVAIGAWIRAVEDAGFDYLTIYDHVVGVNPRAHAGWEPRGPGNPFYTHESAFQEPFTLLSYAAAITERVGLATGVLVLGQRQTALVAKQAAEVDVLSDGRLRLGVGTGWNDVEYEALGVDFATRGARTDEQIEVVRRLWTEPVVEFEGRWHSLRHVGILPLPTQRPIPLWIGGESTPAYRRAAARGDGFCFNVDPDEGATRVALLRDELAAAGRSDATFGIEAMVREFSSLDGVAPVVDAWVALGATHVAIDVMYMGLDGVGGHLDAVRALGARLTR